MSVFTLVLYGISLGLGAGLLLLALPLRRRFGGEDFSPFFSYLAAFTVSGFLNLFGRSLAVSLLHASTPQSQVTIDLIFGFLIFPFMLAALYFFILFIGALLRSAVSAKLKRGYAVFAAAVILVLIIVTARYLDARLVEPAARVLGVINAGILLAYVIVSGWGLAGTWAIEDPRRRRWARLVGVSYLVFFGLGLVLPWGWIRRQFLGIWPLPMILFYFSSNVPALLVFRRFQDGAPADGPALDPVDNDLASFFAGRGLTPREIEVVGLVLQGRSNKDIEKALFISIHTVKNHLYKIYQKLGVRSRFQVVAMVREGKNGSLENGGDEPLNS